MRLRAWLLALTCAAAWIGSSPSPAAAQPPEHRHEPSPATSPPGDAPAPPADHQHGDTTGQADHRHGDTNGQAAPPQGGQVVLPPFVKPITDADRAAAFPALHDHDHPVHGQSINSFLLFEQLEWRNATSDTLAWDTKGWVGGDLDRLWMRSEGDAEDGGVQEAQLHLMYGRAISRWWDVLAGVRQDWRPGPPQTWAAIGIQGLAPYLFDVEATAYIGGGGRAHLRVETSYDLLITNRWIAQPLLEFEIAGKADPRREVGSGLTVGEVSVRLRYEGRRELAPYVGILWRRTFFGTADLARQAGREVGGMAVTIGGRVWF